MTALKAIWALLVSLPRILDLFEKMNEKSTETNFTKAVQEQTDVILKSYNEGNAKALEDMLKS